MPLFSVNVNGDYIGTMILTAAHIVAKAMCVKMGDVVTFVDNIPDDDWYYDTNPYRVITTYTYFHNGTSVMCCEEVCDENEIALDAMLTDNVRKVRDGNYSRALSEFKFHKSDRCACHPRQTHRAFTKRTITRTSRRVGKAMTKWEIAAEGY